jgi:RNA recognition motif-containing protein
MGIFLRGIPPTTTQDDLESKFAPYGKIVQVSIVPSRTHDTYTAYVDFDNETAAQKVGSLVGEAQPLGPSSWGD